MKEIKNYSIGESGLKVDLAYIGGDVEEFTDWLEDQKAYTEDEVYKSSGSTRAYTRGEVFSLYTDKTDTYSYDYLIWVEEDRQEDGSMLFNFGILAVSEDL